MTIPLNLDSPAGIDHLKHFWADCIHHEVSAWTFSIRAEDEKLLISTLAHHGIAPLLHHRLASSKHQKSWPRFLTEYIARTAIQFSAWEMYSRQELEQFIEQASRINIEPVFLKGCAMAYRIYSRPDLRWRLDTDIFVAPDQFERLQQLLAVRGYTPALQHDGPLVSQQVSMIKNGKQGGNICIDLHREISNNTLFGNILSGELLGRNTVSLAQLHPNARCPSNLWLLLHALIHRVDHHNNDDRLLWLYDIHLLTTSGEFKQKLELLMRWIGRYQIISIALAGLQLTHDYFPNNNLLQGIRQLQKSSSTVPEPSAAYLQKRSRGETLRLSLRNTPGSAGKIRLLLQHAFPSLAYMKEKYHFDNDLLAPWYYGKRLLLAIGKLGHLQP